MTWASVSLRKMELKNKINSMESQLIDISKQLQQVANQSSTKETMLSLWNNYNLSGINDEYTDNMQLAQNTNWTAVSAINDCESADELQAYIDKYNTETESTLAVDLSVYDTTTAEGLAAAKEALISAIPETAFTENASLDGNDTVFGNVSVNTNYYSATSASTIRYNQQKSALETQKNAESDMLRNETDTQTQALEARQEALQTQIKVVRAEYDSLGEAMDKDIETSTIKLV